MVIYHRVTVYVYIFNYTYIYIYYYYHYYNNYYYYYYYIICIYHYTYIYICISLSLSLFLSSLSLSPAHSHIIHYFIETTTTRTRFASHGRSLLLRIVVIVIILRIGHFLGFFCFGVLSAGRWSRPCRKPMAWQRKLKENHGFGKFRCTGCCFSVSAPWFDVNLKVCSSKAVRVFHIRLIVFPPANPFFLNIQPNSQYQANSHWITAI